MDLHFCSQCGISIPQSQIDSGVATGTNGKVYCTEHRSGAAVAVAESPGPSGGGATEPELLFCANCQVSIPLGDSQSGRARKEFGSLLCAGCSKADPGERAARREAVEAEMASDVRAADPVVARRCSVCSAAVPYAQIVTGKAKVDGNRVVCERCHAAAAASPPAAAEGAWSSNVVLVIVVLAAGGIGYFVTQAFIDQKKATKDATADANAALRAEVDRRFAEFDARLADAVKRAGEPAERSAAELARVDAELARLNQLVNDIRAAAGNSDADLAQRVARLEGTASNLSEMVRGLAARTPSAPPAPPPIAEKPERAPATDKPPPVVDPPKKDVAIVNPDVVKYCRDLLESSDDGIRFTAANELAKLKDPSSIPSLVKALGDDKHYFVRRGCARALGAIKAWLAVPALIKSLEDREVYVALQANQALQNVTGNDFGVTQDTPAGQRKTKAQAAEKWWDKNKDHPPEGVCLHSLTD
jgi:hypothetical protein